MKYVISALAVYIAALGLEFTFYSPQKPKVLVFTKTAGYRHSSIDSAVVAIKQLGESHGFQVEATSNTTVFTEEKLNAYAALVFLHTTGNLLNARQEADLERYIQAGGGFVGIHAAADAEVDWRWYGRLVGAYFNGHPQQQQACIKVVNNTHASTKHLPDSWIRFDEWYNYRMVDSSINVLMTLDESSYTGGTHGELHPIAWYHNFDGGRSFYTGLGHTEASWTEPLFLRHVLGGIKYAIGANKPLDYRKTKSTRTPDEKAFKKTILTSGTLSEPTEMAILPLGNLLIAQRRGELIHVNAASGKLDTAAVLPVYHSSTDTTVNAEEGLLGITLDPDFQRHPWVYLYFSAVDKPVNRLSRFKFYNRKLDTTTEQLLLEVPTQRDICCHTGGSLAFGAKRMLYISTGDNTTPFNEPGQAFTSQGFAPLDDRPGHEQYDDRRSAGNTNDLRGKILRIQISVDGRVSIPPGNLFPPGVPNTRPEIYVMGTRNPYRISIDSKTGYLYWGEIGPDAAKDDSLRGPRGFDEVNQARAAGNFGYPFVIGDNYPYRSFDYQSGHSGDFFDPKKPVNNSLNNTGLHHLPPSQPALIWYPYGASYLFPQLGSGGRSAMAGPVYYYNAHTKAGAEGKYNAADSSNGSGAGSSIKDVAAGSKGNAAGNSIKNLPGSSKENVVATNKDNVFSSNNIMAAKRLPPYYDGKLFIYDWMRGWIKAVTLNPDGSYSKMEPFMEHTTFNSPIDMELGPDGALYVLEYGKGWYSKNADAALSRIEYDPGNKTPNILASPRSTTPTVDSAAFKAGHIQKTNVANAGLAAIKKSDCLTCHNPNERSIGPSFKSIANRYTAKEKDITYLANKIISGGSGVWGAVAMPAHPALSPEEARMMVDYIMQNK